MEEQEIKEAREESALGSAGGAKSRTMATVGPEHWEGRTALVGSLNLGPGERTTAAAKIASTCWSGTVGDEGNDIYKSESARARP